MATTTRLTLAQVTQQVAEEWKADGKPLALPPDSTPDGSEDAFWDEVQRRFDAQDGV